MSTHNYTYKASTISIHALSVVEEKATQVASHVLYNHLLLGSQLNIRLVKFLQMGTS